MLFPIIRVRDNDNGHEHIVGTDSHDTLSIEEGMISYYNLQNGEGSQFGTYSFLGQESEMGLYVQFVTFDELQKIHDDEVVKKAENDKKLEEWKKRIIEERGFL